MTATITALPTAAKSFFTVRRFRRAWAVELVTTGDSKLTRTRLSIHAERAEALETGKRCASRQNRPFKLGGAL